MPKNKISKKEIMNRGSYVLLGFFLVYLVDPVKAFFENNLPINPFVVSIVGIILTLYFFDFE